MQTIIKNGRRYYCQPCTICGVDRWLQKSDLCHTCCRKCGIEKMYALSGGFEPWLRSRANELRDHMTSLEESVKSFLNNRAINYEPQVPIVVGERRGFIIDFILADGTWLEVNGPFHSTVEGQDRDKRLTAYCESHNIRLKFIQSIEDLGG